MVHKFLPHPFISEIMVYSNYIMHYLPPPPYYNLNIINLFFNVKSLNLDSLGFNTTVKPILCDLPIKDIEIESYKTGGC